MEFTEIRSGELVYTAVPELGVPHMFTTRFGGVDTGTHASLNLAIGRTDDREAIKENYRRIAAELGLRPDRLVWGIQVHGTDVLPAEEADLCRFGVPAREGDGIMTDVPGIGLMIYTADCVPILLHDPVRHAVAALHAGWRGSLSDMAGAGVRAMAKQYGSDPGDILAAIGPSIGQCCFEAGPEVKDMLCACLGQEAGAFITDGKPGKYFIDLKGADRALLIRAGVKAENIAVSAECTRCLPDKYWSYRFHGEARGSQGAVIALPEI